MHLGYGCCNEGGGQEVPSELVIAGGDPAPVLQPAPKPVDEVAGFVGLVGDLPHARRTRWNDRLSAALR